MEKRKKHVIFSREEAVKDESNVIIIKEGFKITKINILRNLMAKVDSMCEQMGNFSIKLKIIKRNQIVILKLKIKK